jgi:predicted permease
VGDEVREELDFHLAMLVRELVEGGMSAEEAEREASRRFGSVAGIGAECRRIGKDRERQRRWKEWLVDVGQDVRFAGRTLLRSPGFAIAAIVTMALGVGATTAIFSVVDGVLLRSLPFPAAGRLVVPQTLDRKSGDRWLVSYADYEEWRAKGVFGRVAVYQAMPVDLSGGSGASEAERVNSLRMSDDFIAAVGLAPVVGRAFTAEEFEYGAAPVAMISDALWRRRFGGARDVVGRALRMGEPVRVVGVLSPEYRALGDADVYLPLRIRPESRADYEDRDNFAFQAIARLAPGKTLEETRAELAGMARQVEEQYPTLRAGTSVTALPLSSVIVGDRVSRGLWLFLGAVSLVLLIGCVNVANLLLARSAARQREIAIRAALGAGRGRLVRQLLTESLAIGVLGGVAGVGLAYLGVRALVAGAPAYIPRLDEVSVSGPVLVFALGISMLSALLFGLVPSLRASAVHPGVVSEGGARAGSGRRERAGRDALVVTELALSVILLVAAGLLLRSFTRLKQTDPGFRTASLLTFTLGLHGDRYGPDGRAAATFEELLRRIRALPGVRGAAIISSLPLGGGGFYNTRAYLAQGRPEPPAGPEVIGPWEVISPGYFDATGMPRVRGRDFSERDGAGSPPVAIVSRSFARAMFPGQDPIGKRVRSWRDENVYREVVGVVDDVRMFGAGDEIRPIVYVPHRQSEWRDMAVVVRGASDPHALVRPVRAVLRGIDPSVAMGDVQTMDEVLAQSVAPWRFGSALIGVFAALALALAAIGLYGVLAYAIARRTREIGIRMALGAEGRDIRRMVLEDAARVIAAGLLVGGAAAFLATRAMTALLYDTSPADPLTFAVVALVLGGVALLASWIPTRRAVAVDPVEALRYE